MTGMDEYGSLLTFRDARKTWHVMAIFTRRILTKQTPTVWLKILIDAIIVRSEIPMAPWYNARIQNCSIVDYEPAESSIWLH